jgi:hypothetical protein
MKILRTAQYHSCHCSTTSFQSKNLHFNIKNSPYKLMSNSENYLVDNATLDHERRCFEKIKFLNKLKKINK